MEKKEAVKLFREIAEHSFSESFLNKFPGADMMLHKMQNGKHTPVLLGNNFHDILNKYSSQIESVIDRYALQIHKLHFYFLIIYCTDDFYMDVKSNGIYGFIYKSGKEVDHYDSNRIKEFNSILNDSFKKITFYKKDLKEKITIYDTSLIDKIQYLISQHNWEADLPTIQFFHNNEKYKEADLIRNLAKMLTEYFKSIDKTSNVSNILAGWILIFSGHRKEANYSSEYDDKGKRAIKTDVDNLIGKSIQSLLSYEKKSEKHY